MFTTRERVILFVWLLSWLLVPVAAQVRPGLFSTLATTDTTANSLVVGGTAGGTTGTGGIKAGPISGTLATLTGGTVMANNLASTALNARFNASNPLMGVGIANSNGFPYLAVNTVSQVSSDTPKYDINGFAAQLRMDSGVFRFLTAPSGTAGNAITLTERWGINNAGDHTFGTSSHIADSSGTPTINSGFGTTPTIAGTDYAMNVTIVAGASIVGGTINFGHTFSSAPACVSTSNSQGMLTTVSTTQVTAQPLAGNFVAGNVISILCRGF